MKKVELIKLDPAVALFNYEGAEVSLVVKMIKNKTEINNNTENVKKQLQELSKNLKPGEIETLETQLKLALEKEDQEKIKSLQLRINFLSAEWSKKYTEAENTIFQESINVKLDKISQEELMILMKPKKEVVSMKETERQVVVTNHFTTETLASLAPLLK